MEVVYFCDTNLHREGTEIHEGILGIIVFAPGATLD